MRADARLALALGLALLGCEREAREAAPSATETVPGAVAIPTPIREELPGEVQAEDLFGTWRVVGVVPDAGSTYARNDPRITGALMDIYAEKLGWSFLPDKGFRPEEVCLGPISGLATQSADAGAIRADLAPALATVKPGRRLSRPHRWMCGDGGEWGGEAGFQLAGRDEMAMRWHGGVSLLLHRIQRASKVPPGLPPTGAYEGPADVR